MAISRDDRAKIIKALLKEEVTEINWKLEMICLGKLMKKYPGEDFWRSFNPGYRVHSLRWFVGDGLKDIRKFHSLFNLDFQSKEKTILSNQSFGEDYKVPVSIPSLSEFLKKY